MILGLSTNHRSSKIHIIARIQPMGDSNYLDYVCNGNTNHGHVFDGDFTLENVTCKRCVGFYHMSPSKKELADVLTLQRTT